MKREIFIDIKKTKIDTSWLSTALEEYKTLRTESLESMKMQHSILAYGIVGISALMTVGLNKWDSPLYISEAISLILLPIFINLILLTWMGEVTRMFRAGQFISTIEEKINLKFTDTEKPLSWETWLQERYKNGKTPHHDVQIHYVAIFALFILISVISVIFGYIKISDKVIFCLRLKIILMPLALTLYVIWRGIKMSRQNKKRY